MAKVEMMGVATFRWKQHSSKLNLQPILLSHGHYVGVVRGIGRLDRPDTALAQLFRPVLRSGRCAARADPLPDRCRLWGDGGNLADQHIGHARRCGR